MRKLSCQIIGICDEIAIVQQKNIDTFVSEEILIIFFSNGYYVLPWRVEDVVRFVPTYLHFTLYFGGFYILEMDCSCIIDNLHWKFLDHNILMSIARPSK